MLHVEEHGFSLRKGTFFNAVALRSNWHPTHMHTNCVCVATFIAEHVLSYPRGGFPFIHHNEIRDLSASLLTEVCNDIHIEPDLQPLR